jgi:hypothetical protein
MTNPNGAKALLVMPKPLRRVVSARSKLSLLPRIGERSGEWFEIPSYGKKGLRDIEKTFSHTPPDVSHDGNLLSPY